MQNSGRPSSQGLAGITMPRAAIYSYGQISSSAVKRLQVAAGLGIRDSAHRPVLVHPSRPLSPKRCTLIYAYCIVTQAAIAWMERGFYRLRRRDCILNTVRVHVRVALDRR